MYIDTNKRKIDISRPYTAPDGTRWPNLRNPDLRKKYGIKEIPDPKVEDSRYYDIGYLDVPPYVVNTPKHFYDKHTTDADGNEVVIKGLKSQIIDRNTQAMKDALKATDADVLHALELGVPVDPKIAKERKAIRDKYGLKLKALRSARSHKDVELADKD